MSPLFQILGANALIDRPEEFRQMQRSIDVELDSLQPGVRLDYLYQKSDRLRNSIAGITSAIGLSVIINEDTLSKSHLAVRIGNATFVQTLSDTVLLSTLFDQARLRAIKRVDTLLMFAFNAFSQESFKDAAALALLNGLQNSGVSSRLTVPEGGTRSQVAARLVNALFERSYDAIKMNLPSVHLLNRRLDSLTKEQRAAMKSEIESKFAGFVNDVRDKILTAVTVAESRLASSVSSYASTLISGTAGLAIKESGGDANGGVLFSFMLDTNSQFGIFLNSQLSSPDPGSAGPFMAAAHYRGAIGPTQFDLFGSFIYGDATLANTGIGFEGGAGFSHSTGNIVVGLAGIVLHKAGANTVTLGAQLRRADNSSPALTIGFNWDPATKRVKPIFQFGVPLVATKGEG